VAGEPILRGVQENPRGRSARGAGILEIGPEPGTRHRVIEERKKATSLILGSENGENQ
jgi:hypothetical protein